jgi:hypothetical protein
MSDTVDARPALRPDAFAHPNSPRRFDLEISPPTPIPTKADVMSPSYWSDVDLRPRDTSPSIAPMAGSMSS